MGRKQFDPAKVKKNDETGAIEPLQGDVEVDISKKYFDFDFTLLTPEKQRETGARLVVPYSKVTEMVRHKSAEVADMFYWAIYCGDNKSPEVVTDAQANAYLDWLDTL